MSNFKIGQRVKIRDNDTVFIIYYMTDEPFKTLPSGEFHYGMTLVEEGYDLASGHWIQVNDSVIEPIKEVGNMLYEYQFDYNRKEVTVLEHPDMAGSDRFNTEKLKLTKKVRCARYIFYMYADTKDLYTMDIFCKKIDNWFRERYEFNQVCAEQAHKDWMDFENFYWNTLKDKQDMFD